MRNWRGYVLFGLIVTVGTTAWILMLAVLVKEVF